MHNHFSSQEELNAQSVWQRLSKSKKILHVQEAIEQEKDYFANREKRAEIDRIDGLELLRKKRESSGRTPPRDMVERATSADYSAPESQDSTKMDEQMKEEIRQYREEKKAKMKRARMRKLKRERWLKHFLVMQQRSLREVIERLTQHNLSKIPEEKPYKREKQVDLVHRLAHMTQKEIAGKKTYYLEQQWDIMRKRRAQNRKLKQQQQKQAEEKDANQRPRKVKAAPPVDRAVKYLNDNQFKLETRVDPSILSTFFLEKFQEDLQFFVGKYNLDKS